RGRGSLRAAREQADTRGDRHVPGASRVGNRGASARVRHRGAWKDRLRHLAAVTQTPRGDRLATAAIRPRRRREAWRVMPDAHRLLPSEPAEHEYWQADGADDGKRFPEGEEG